MKTRTQIAAESTHVEDTVLADIMLFVRKFNGNEPMQSYAACLLMDQAVELGDKVKAMEAAGDCEKAFVARAAMFGCISIVQKAVEEWERHDREGGTGDNVAATP